MQEYRLGEMRSVVIFSCCLLFTLSFALNAQESGGGQPNADAAQTQSTQTPSANPGDDHPPGPQQPAASGASVSAQELANQVNNPAAPVTFIQFRNILDSEFPRV